MVTIVTRAAKGEALTHDEVDANFNNLNSGKAEVSALTAHTGNTANPHAVTKAQVGLGNVDNTSDLAKPVSTATQTALNGKEATITAGTTAQYWRGDKSWQTLDKAAVGLANVDNTSDASKPVSTAQQTALNAKANLSGAAFTGPVSATALDSTPIGQTTPAAVKATTLASTGDATVAGNIGIGTGISPHAWGGALQGAIEGKGAAFFATQSSGVNVVILGVAAYYDNSGWKYAYNSQPASYYDQYNGAHHWYSAPTSSTSGAGTTATFTNTMTLDSSGNLLVGVTSGSNHIIAKNVAEGNGVLYVHNGTGVFITFMNGTAGGANGAGSVAYLNKNSTTSRSINAAGTINASGADYAEYMRKALNCGLIAKGAIVGVNAAGELTDKWDDAISFVVKSTDPSYVGGDTWGSEEALGLTRPTDTEAEDYAERLAEFEAALEEARSRVDRIAFAGQVPVNVLGATVGDYIVPVQDGDGIKGIAVAEDGMTLKQYMKAVGIVQNILPDGRANIRVKVA